MLLLTLAQVYVIAAVCTISIITLAIISFITSVNGTIRITSVVVQNKKIRIVLPVINVINMLFIYYMAKNKLTYNLLEY